MITYKQLFITTFNLKVAVAQYLIYTIKLAFEIWKYTFWVYDDCRSADAEIVNWHASQFLFLVPSLTQKIVCDFWYWFIKLLFDIFICDNWHQPVPFAALYPAKKKSTLLRISIKQKYPDSQHKENSWLSLCLGGVWFKISSLAVQF